MRRYDSHSDEQLLSLLKDGDKGAFTEIYNRYWEKLFFVAGRKLEDLPLAEELVQDIFADLWNRRSSLELTSALGAYLAAAGKYKVIDARRRRFREKQYRQGSPDGTEQSDHFTQHYLDFEALKEQLARLVPQLPERCRLTFQLSREEGLSHEEIAKVMNISEKAVERNLTRALRTLRLGLRQLFNLLAALLLLWFRR